MPYKQMHTHNVQIHTKQKKQADVSPGSKM